MRWSQASSRVSIIRHTLWSASPPSAAPNASIAAPPASPSTSCAPPSCQGSRNSLKPPKVNFAREQRSHGCLVGFLHAVRVAIGRGAAHVVSSKLSGQRLLRHLESTRQALGLEVDDLVAIEVVPA